MKKSLLSFILFISIFFYSYSKEIFSLDNKVRLIPQGVGNFNLKEKDLKNALDAFIGSCNKFLSMDEETHIFTQYSNNVNVYDISDICSSAVTVKNKNDVNYIKFFFKNYFAPYLVIDNINNSFEGIFTGYYLPKIKVKKEKDYFFKYPIYKRPKDLIVDVPYYTRKEINSGILEGQNLELFYTNDLVDLYFLQIQGSGIAIDVDTNELIKIGFDGKNNREYSSIGKILKDNGLLAENVLNSISIKNFLKDNIDTAQKLMDLNESYIFFKILDSKVVGTQGVELVDNISLAVDKTYIPLGFPIFIDTNLTLKDGNIRKFKKIMVSHDTGSAIKGVVRGDIFFGSGEKAEELASYQYSSGSYYIMIPLDIENILLQDND